MGKVRASGANAQLLGGFEATYGAGLDGSGGDVYKSLRFKSVSLGDTKEINEDDLLGQGRSSQDPYYDPPTNKGDIVVPVELRDFGVWLKGLLGDPVTTGASAPYTHVFEDGIAELPSLCLDAGHTDLTIKRIYNIVGVKLDTLGFTMDRSGPLNATLGVIAQGETEGTVVADTNPKVAVLSRFSKGKGAIKSGGTSIASVNSASFEFANGLEAVETVRDDGLIDGIDEGIAKASGSVKVRWGKKSVMETAADDETPLAMELSFTMAGGYSLKFEMPRCFFSKPGRSVSGPAGIESDHSFQASKDSGLGYAMRVTLINDVASYSRWN